MGVLKDNITPPTEAEKISFLKRILKVFDENNVDYWLAFGTLLGCVRDHRFIPWDTDIDIGVFDINKVTKIKDNLEKKNLEIKKKGFDTSTPILVIRDKLIPPEVCFHTDIYEFLKKDDMYVYKWPIRKNLICRTANYIAYIFRREPFLNAGQYRIKLTKILIDFTKIIPEKLMDIMHNIFYNVDFFFSINRVLVFNDFKTKKVKFYDMMVKIPNNAKEHLLVIYGKNWRTPMKVSQNAGDEFLVSKTQDGTEICMLQEKIMENKKIL